MRQLFFMVFLFCNCLLYSQTENLTNSNNINSITNDSLKTFVSNFKTAHYPFEIAETNEGDAINIGLLNQLFDLNIEPVEIGLEEYYCGNVFYDNDFFGLTLTHYYTPGAFGIENYFIELITMTYEGKVIDNKELGCFCNDTNMGSNDYTATEPVITIDAGKISVNTKIIHATLIEEEGVESFEDISYEETIFDINPDCLVNQNTEKNN